MRSEWRYGQNTGPSYIGFCACRRGKLIVEFWCIRDRVYQFNCTNKCRVKHTLFPKTSVYLWISVLSEVVFSNNWPANIRVTWRWLKKTCHLTGCLQLLRGKNAFSRRKLEIITTHAFTCAHAHTQNINVICEYIHIYSHMWWVYNSDLWVYKWRSLCFLFDMNFYIKIPLVICCVYVFENN